MSHPVFLPLFSIFAYSATLATYENSAKALAAVWVAFAYVLLPFLYFRVVRKINLPQPSMDERRSIYRAYLLINLGFVLVSFYIMPAYIGFFLGGFLMHVLLLLLAFVELKASWHTAAWSFVVMTGLMVMYTLGLQDMSGIVLIPFAIALLVSLARWRVGAHTLFEIGMGAAAGFFGAIPVLFLT